MKALSLYQPWASLVICGVKHFETRSWRTGYRGTLVIHAAKAPKPPSLPRARAFQLQELCRDVGIGEFEDLPRGALIGTVLLADCFRVCIQRGVPRDLSLYLGQPGEVFKRTCITDTERSLGDWRDGRYAWRLTAAQAFRNAVPCRGRQGLWTVPDELVDLMDLAGYLEDR